MMDTTLASIFAGAYDGHAESLTADLAHTPFVGEGARKVLTRLRIQDDIRASRARVSPLDARTRLAFAPPATAETAQRS
ncbi:MAG: hypothetical protein VB142_05450 [Burkholderia sp.]